MFFKWGKKLSTLHFSKKGEGHDFSPPLLHFQDRQERSEFFSLSPDCSSVHIPPPRKKFDKSVFNGVYFFPFFVATLSSFLSLSRTPNLGKRRRREKMSLPFAYTNNSAGVNLTRRLQTGGGRERAKTNKRTFTEFLFCLSIDAWQNLLNSR